MYTICPLVFLIFQLNIAWTKLILKFADVNFVVCCFSANDCSPPEGEWGVGVGMGEGLMKIHGYT